MLEKPQNSPEVASLTLTHTNLTPETPSVNISLQVFLNLFMWRVPPFRAKERGAALETITCWRKYKRAHRSKPALQSELLLEKNKSTPSDQSESRNQQRCGVLQQGRG